MEELVSYLIVYLLQADGTYLKEVYQLTREISLVECMAFREEHRNAIATYDDKANRWWLNDKSGNAWFGHECAK